MKIRNSEEIKKQIAFIIESYEGYKKFDTKTTPKSFIDKHYYDIKDWILKKI